MERLLIDQLLDALAEREVGAFGEHLELDRERRVGERVDGDERRPRFRLAIERGHAAILVGGPAVFQRVHVIAEVTEQRVEQTRVAPFVLRHGRARDPGLELGRAEHPVGEAHAEQALRVGEDQDEVADVAAQDIVEVGSVRGFLQRAHLSAPPRRRAG
jgi:hypothetical protein